MREPAVSPIVWESARVLAPPIQVVGLYVLCHGHYSPGGGFQGGVLLAASFLLLRMALGQERSGQLLGDSTAAALSAIGVLVFALTGVVALLSGGNLMDYAFVPMPYDGADRRSLAILLIEAAVALTVATTLVLLFDVLIEEDEDDQPGEPGGPTAAAGADDAAEAAAVAEADEGGEE